MLAIVALVELMVVLDAIIMHIGLPSAQAASRFERSIGRYPALALHFTAKI